MNSKTKAMLLLLITGGILWFKRPKPAEAQVVMGCTDPNAINYNPLATEDDGSCLFDAVSELIDFKVQYHVEGEGEWHEIPVSWNSYPVDSINGVSVVGGELIANSIRTINWSTGIATYGWEWQVPDAPGKGLSIKVSLGDVAGQADLLII